MGKDRLAELQAASKHVKSSDVDASNAEEMKPLKEKDKAMSTSQADFFEALNEVTANIDTVSFKHWMGDESYSYCTLISNYCHYYSPLSDSE